ncbi:uncharacterized protein LOC135208901 [Macrobrachium nipponense]|uniref:uncharacterized protein LOC135208901 n=1 Tax=Macrobrachium nipponense TaxID=159736 RepID=UPI0030C862F7
MKFIIALAAVSASVCLAEVDYGYAQDNTVKINHGHFKYDPYGKGGAYVDGGYSTSNFVLKTPYGYSFGGLGNAGVHGSPGHGYGYGHGHGGGYGVLGHGVHGGVGHLGGLGVGHGLGLGVQKGLGHRHGIHHGGLGFGKGLGHGLHGIVH